MGFFTGHNTTNHHPPNPTQVLEVNIEKGMKHQQKITFNGLADEKPNMEPGNIVFVVQEKEHATFKRKGGDLLITKTVSLNEALCGFSWVVNHLDGRQLLIKSTPGEVIRAEGPGGQPFVKCIVDEGMPTHGSQFQKGKLYILFTVQFPKDNELSEAAMNTLRKTLPNPAAEVDCDEEDENVEVVHMEVADVKSFGKLKAGLGGSSAYDEDSDDGGDQKGVQCQQS